MKTEMKKSLTRKLQINDLSELLEQIITPVSAQLSSNKGKIIKHIFKELTAIKKYQELLNWPQFELIAQNSLDSKILAARIIETKWEPKEEPRKDALTGQLKRNTNKYKGKTR